MPGSSVIDTLLIPLLKIAIVLNATLVAVTYMVLLERKVIAWAQSRLGPMRVGPYGILQPVAAAGRQMGLHGGADHLDGARAHRVRGDSVRPDREPVRAAGESLHHRHQRR